MHGRGASSKYFYFMGWVAGLRDHYRLISIDARGHGSSGKPHKPEAYRMRLMAGDVTAVFDDLGIDKAHYFGYSMSGLVGWGLAKYAPERVISLIIGGMDAEYPYPSLDKDPEVQEYRRILRKGRDAVTKALVTDR
jgi:pimeloyl-ACP methyl ester carboxylesterase